MKLISIEKTTIGLWSITVPIRYEAETLDFLNGMEQTSTIGSNKKTTEVTFSVYLSDRCEEADLVDAENTIKGWSKVLESRCKEGDTNL